jgi:hypothetical protein
MVDGDGRIVSDGTEAVVGGGFRFAVPIDGAVIDPDAPPYRHTLAVREAVAGGRLRITALPVRRRCQTGTVPARRSSWIGSGSPAPAPGCVRPS